jgi:hypothetical protein
MYRKGYFLNPLLQCCVDWCGRSRYNCSDPKSVVTQPRVRRITRFMRTGVWLTLQAGAFSSLYQAQQ